MASSHSSGVQPKRRARSKEPPILTECRFDDERAKSKHHVNSSPPILTENRFASINDDDDMSSDDNNEDQHHQKRNNFNHIKWCPPITVKQLQYDEITSTMKDINITEYKIKLTSLGLRLQCRSEKDHQEVIKHFTTKKLEFFTYELRSNKLLKFIITGLPTIPPEEVKKELTLKGIKNIVDVKSLIIRNKRYDDHNNYLVSFPPKAINIKQLKETRDLFHVIIHWEPYHRKITGPPVCSRCQLHGHGPWNCITQDVNFAVKVTYRQTAARHTPT